MAKPMMASEAVALWVGGKSQMAIARSLGYKTAYDTCSAIDRFINERCEEIGILGEFDYGSYGLTLSQKKDLAAYVLTCGSKDFLVGLRRDRCPEYEYDPLWLCAYG